MDTAITKKYCKSLTTGLTDHRDVQEIHIDIGQHFDPTKAQLLKYNEFDSWSNKKKCVTVYSTKRNTDATAVIQFLKQTINSDRPKRFIYLTLDGVRLGDWNVLNGLNIAGFTFQNMQVTNENIVQLANCRYITPELQFIDCNQFDDQMLLTFLNTHTWMTASVTVRGSSAITKSFFYQYAREQCVTRGLPHFDFREMEPTIAVESFERYTTMKYTMIGRSEIIDDFDD